MHYLVIGGITAALVTGLAWFISRLAPRQLDSDSGTIVPERWTAAFTVVGGLVFVAVGCLAVIAGEWKIGSVGVAMGLAIAGFMAPSLTDLHIVHWTNLSAEGPSRMFGPTLGLSRTEIAWADVVKTGKTITGYWFIQANDGRRIYGSYLYKGYGAFVAAISSHRPDMQLPEDLR